MTPQRAIEIRLPEFALYTPKPNHPDWDELKLEAHDLATRIAQRMIVPTSPLKKILHKQRRISALVRTFKNLIHNKLKMTLGDENFIPLFYIWTTTNKCNFDCTYCSNHRNETYPELYKKGHRDDLTTDQSKQLIRIMKDSSAVYWCGGEPTLRKDLPELLEYATQLDMFNLINTNGSVLGDLLTKPGYEKFLAQMDVIIISLDSLDISRLAEVYRVKDTIARKTLRNILTLSMLQNHAPFKLAANTVITRDTIEDAFDILDLCNDLRITYSPVSANIGHEPDRELINNPRYQALVNQILARAREGYPMIASPQMLDRVLNADIAMCYPAVFDHIDHDGKMFWPCKPYLGAKMVNVLDHRTVYDVREAAGKLIDPTKFHGDGPNQCQGHCQWMQHCASEKYAKAMIEGFLESGIIGELLGLLT